MTPRDAVVVLRAWCGNEHVGFGGDEIEALCVLLDHVDPPPPPPSAALLEKCRRIEAINAAIIPRLTPHEPDPIALAWGGAIGVPSPSNVDPPYPPEPDIAPVARGWVACSAELFRCYVCDAPAPWATPSGSRHRCDAHVPRITTTKAK